MQRNSLIRRAAVVALSVISAPWALPLRAAESVEVAIRHGKELTLAAEYKNAERELRSAMKRLGSVRDDRYFAAAANLGVALYYRGDYAQAEAAYGQALAIRDRLPAASLVDVAVVLSNLSALYSHTGRTRLAESFGEEAVRLREQVEGPDSANLAVPLITLAASYYDSGRYQDAEEQARRAVSVISHSGTNANLPAALHQLALIRLKQGDLDEADLLLSRMKELLERPSVPAGPTLANAYSALGALRLAQRRYGEAAETLQRAISLWQQLERAKSREIAAALNNLAQVHKLTGDYAKAGLLYRDAIAACEGALGRQHSICAPITGNYADLNRLEGHLSIAEQLYESAIAVLEKSLPSDHPDLVRLRTELAVIVEARHSVWTVSLRDLQRSAHH